MRLPSQALPRPEPPICLPEQPLTSHRPLGAMPPPLLLSCPCSHVGDGCLLFDLTADISPPRTMALSCLDRPASSTPRARDGRSTRLRPIPLVHPIPLDIAHLPGQIVPIGCFGVHPFTWSRGRIRPRLSYCVCDDTPFSTLWSMLPFGIPGSCDPCLLAADHPDMFTREAAHRCSLTLLMILLPWCCHRPPVRQI